MIKDNVTPFKQSTSPQPTSPISLDDVLASVKIWRVGKKKRNDKIPDNIWCQIFKLFETMPESRVLGILGITQGQLHTKRQESQLDKIDLNADEQAKTQAIDFCEVKPTFPIDYKAAKAFSTTTSVVELYRPDGMLMKIHISTDSFEDLLRAFFKG